jgi:hypothetical protein
MEFEARGRAEFACNVEKSWKYRRSLTFDSTTIVRGEIAMAAIQQMQRRRVLQGLAALIGAGCFPPALAQSAALSPAQIAGLSRGLTGFAYQDPALAASLLRALASSVGAQNLARIAALASSTPPDRLGDALRDAKLDKIAATVVVALYSGVVETAKGPVIFTYNEALAWQAVPWTKPNALCGGVTDYWSSAPAESK